MEFRDREKIYTFLLMNEQPKKWWSVEELFERLRNELACEFFKMCERFGSIESAFGLMKELENKGVKFDIFTGDEIDDDDIEWEIDEFKRKLYEFLCDMTCGNLLEGDYSTHPPKFRIIPLRTKIRRCKNCGRWFEAKRKNQEFCKKGCKVNYHKKHCDKCRKLERLRKQKSQPEGNPRLG